MNKIWLVTFNGQQKARAVLSVKLMTRRNWILVYFIVYFFNPPWKFKTCLAIPQLSKISYFLFYKKKSKEKRILTDIDRSPLRCKLNKVGKKLLERYEGVAKIKININSVQQHFYDSTTKPVQVKLGHSRSHQLQL